MAEQIIQLAKNVLKRVVCLYRVSTVGQVEKDDIPMQKQFCREFVQRQPGWEIVKEFSEKGVSGFKVSAKKRDAVQEIQRMADGFLLAAVPGVAVEVQGQASHGLRQDADAGIHRRHLHGAPLGDGFAGCRAAEVEGVAAPGGAVLGSIPRMKQAAEKAHENHHPF